MPPGCTDLALISPSTLRREELDVSAAQVGVVLGHGALRLRGRREGDPRLARGATISLAEDDAVVAADLQPEEEACARRGSHV